MAAQEKTFEGHSAKFNIDQLVFVKQYDRADDAIAREKRLRGWNRQNKIDLISGDSPIGKISRLNGLIGRFRSR